VAFEAAYGWGWLVELLEELELEPHLVHPSRCKAIASARLKNDKVDAATLAQLLRADLLPEAWIAPQQVRDLRALLRHRASLVRSSTALKNRVHAVLADRGIGEDRGLWTGPGRAWLADLELPPIPRGIIQDCCGLLDALATPIGRLERQIAALEVPAFPEASEAGPLDHEQGGSLTRWQHHASTHPSCESGRCGYGGPSSRADRSPTSPASLVSTLRFYGAGSAATRPTTASAPTWRPLLSGRSCSGCVSGWWSWGGPMRS
jgi:Transposase